MISRILFCQTFPFERLPFSGQLCCPVLPGCSMLEAERIDPGIWPFDIVAACKPGARNVVIPHPPAENHLRTKRAENGGTPKHKPWFSLMLKVSKGLILDVLWKPQFKKAPNVERLLRKMIENGVIPPSLGDSHGFLVLLSPLFLGG